jgi:tRNA nucleotidyltransferase (CCA-adding enzyme)
LIAGRLRHVSSAFVEDPLRVLRVARFAARLAPHGFAVAAATRALMSEIAASGELRWLATERIWREVQRALEEPAPTRFFDELIACGALAEILAELEPTLAARARGRRALACAADASATGAARFAALTHALDADGSLTQLCRRLPVPKAWAELARLASLWTDALRCAGKAGADDLWAILSGCDALRRPQRFHRLLAVVEYVAQADDAPDPGSGWGERVEAALAAASSVEGGALAREGWQGAALGCELERRRRQAIADRLGAHARASG